MTKRSVEIPCLAPNEYCHARPIIALKEDDEANGETFGSLLLREFMLELGQRNYHERIDFVVEHMTFQMRLRLLEVDS